MKFSLIFRKKPAGYPSEALVQQTLEHINTFYVAWCKSSALSYSVLWDIEQAALSFVDDSFNYFNTTLTVSLLPHTVLIYFVSVAAMEIPLKNPAI